MLLWQMSTRMLELMLRNQANGGSKCRPCVSGRHGSGCERLRKFCKRGRGKRLFNTGPKAAALYGVEVTGLAPTKVRALRTQAVASVCRLKAGASSSVVLIIAYGPKEPGCSAFIRAVRAYIHLVRDYAHLHHSLHLCWLRMKYFQSSSIAAVEAGVGPYHGHDHHVVGL